MSTISEQIAILIEKTDGLLQEVENIKKAIALEYPAIVSAPVKKKLNISAKGMEAKVAAGKKVSQLNSIRKEFIENAKLNGEW